MLVYHDAIVITSETAQKNCTNNLHEKRDKQRRCKCDVPSYNGSLSHHITEVPYQLTAVNYLQYGWSVVV